MEETATIKLTTGQTAIVDREDHERLLSEKWSVLKIRGKLYVAQAKPARKYMHRIIMNAPDGMQVDHIDGNTLDNRKRNLRICTNAQNNWNKGAHRDSSSGIKGVSYDKSRDKWRAMLMVNGDFVLQKRFSTKEMAIIAYREKVAEHCGEFARFA